MTSWAQDWIQPIEDAHWPRVQCPACSKGFLGEVADDREELHDSRSAQTVRLYKAGVDSVHHLSGAFERRFVCEWGGCEQAYVVGGDWELSIDDVDLDHGPHYVNLYQLRFIHPTIPLFCPPPGTPESVRGALLEASAIMWMSPSGAANRLRQGVEELLTSQGVRPGWNLHKRIRQLEETAPRAAAVLLATKIIGNAGSHGLDVTMADVVDAADFIELALRLFYDTADDVVLRRAKKIIDTKPFRSEPQQNDSLTAANRSSSADS